MFVLDLVDAFFIIPPCTIKMILLWFSWLLCNILCFPSLYFWKHNNKYDETNSFWWFMIKLGMHVVLWMTQKLQYNLCRFVEGMAPVFSRFAWYCTWHLIQVILLVAWRIVTWIPKFWILFPSFVPKNIVSLFLG